MKNKIIAVLLVVMSHSAYSHYEVENVKTTTRIFSFDLIHKYLAGHDTNHPNTCKGANSSTLATCTVNYKVVSGGNNKEIKSGFVDLRGDGSYDDELMSAVTHYDSLKVAERHGVDLTQIVEIPRDSVTSLTGGNNQYTVTTTSLGRVCDASAVCKDTPSNGYQTNTLDFKKLTELQVACEFTSKDLDIKTTLSEDNLYLYYGADDKKILPYVYSSDSVSIDCVNWLSTAISKNITLGYESFSQNVSDGDTQLECKLFGDINGSGDPASSTTKMTIPGFSTKDESFKIPEAFLGFYVSSPSGTAQISTEFNCNFKLATEIK
ncbi:hypothetical protein [Morganella psychrotolerans]|uniref:hypothetical protein n=1 Tax=Morganella psychrotolerans TaxID=368603 RepID=UPI0039AFFDDD